MKPAFRFLVPAAFLPLFAACVAVDPEPAVPLATQSEVNYLRSAIEQQRQRIAALEQQIDQLNGSIAQDRYQRDSSSSLYASAAQTTALQQQLADLQKQVRALDDARAKDRAQITEDITKKVSSLVKSSAPARSAAPAVSSTGIEHVVQPGETLSQIAAAYGVKMDIIARVNNISNPASIRVGQKLFIPDP
ncbi:MAG: LysM peptidoglycan-binding domain-containing protein [Kiritimatiellae bacterium]|nr:LysM peptidoglycan-binding domain-containing protein [Kiritimatiellia bacterium]